jgi:hypothetical protein
MSCLGAQPQRVFQTFTIAALPQAIGDYPCTGCESAEAACGLLTDVEGYFTDGSGWDQEYGNDASCMWMIAPDGATSVFLAFIEFETGALLPSLKTLEDIDVLLLSAGCDCVVYFVAQSKTGISFMCMNAKTYRASQRSSCKRLLALQRKL